MGVVIFSTGQIAYKDSDFIASDIRHTPSVGVVIFSTGQIAYKDSDFIARVILDIHRLWV